ncbi:MAG: hypothetical protein V3W44_04165 [Dehalococcoidales bacterium]
MKEHMTLEEIDEMLRQSARDVEERWYRVKVGLAVVAALVVAAAVVIRGS